MSSFVRLKEVANLTVGYVGAMAEQYVDEGIPFLRSLNIKPYEIDDGNIKYISEEFNEKIQKSILHEGDIVIVRTGAPGTCCVVPAVYEGCNCSDVVIVRPDKNKVNAQFLAGYINVWGKKQISNNKVGAVQKHYNVHSAEDMQIPDFNIEDQKKIAKILEKINQKIICNQKINDNLRQQLRTLYDYWFTQFDFPDENGMPYKAAGGNMRYSSRLKKSIPCNWDVTSLSESTTIATDGVNPNHYHGQIMEHYSIPAYDENYMPVFEKAAQIESGKYRVYPDSILVSKLNPKFKRLWDPMCLTENAICSTEFIVYRPINVEFRSFIYGVLDSDAFYAHMVQNAVSSTGSRKRIQPEVSSRFLFPVPKDPTVLRAFCRISTPLLENRNRIIKENQQLVAFREWLLPMLMNGQVTVAD